MTQHNYATFDELPLRALRPHGWLRRYLELQRDGLTGHLEAAGFPFNTAGWAAPLVRFKSGTGWWPYEQTGYWIDGMVRCGHLLDDPSLIARAKAQIDYVLANADADGYLGPKFMKDPEGDNRWPHAVFFRAWMAHYGATGDPRIVPALARHYHAGEPADHCTHRNVCNVETLLWTYGETGNLALLDHAVTAYTLYNQNEPHADTALDNLLSDKRATEHGVTFNEIAKLGAILYMHTGKQRYLDAAVHGYEKIDRDQMLVDGVCSSTERLRGKDPLDSHETCDIADYTWSIGYLLMATGDAAYADKMERACFNAAPGAVRSDFRGLQYFSCPNQVIADERSNHNLFYRGYPWMSYRPNPGTECCPGEVNRIMPNYAARMWMDDGNGGLVAALYGPGKVTTRVGPEQQAVTITAITDYPFSEEIDFEVETETPVAFKLHLRIPGWCETPRLLVNELPFESAPNDGDLVPGTFAVVERTFAPGDRVRLVLPMPLRLQRWPQGGVSVERGPLVFSLGVAETWVVDEDDERATDAFPAWNLYPTSPWNYALAVDEATLDDVVDVVHREMDPEPWSQAHAPLVLRVPARRVEGWTMNRRSEITREVVENKQVVLKTAEGRFAMTPPLPDPETLAARFADEVETIELVPYGCAKLRLTIFPDGKPVAPKHSGDPAER